MVEPTQTSTKKLKTTAVSSVGIGAIGALLLAVIAKKCTDVETKEILTLAVPFLSVWILALGKGLASTGKWVGTRLAAIGKWIGIAYGWDEPAVVKLRRQAKKYRKKLLKELKCKSTSEENKAKIRIRLDELQMDELETYDIK